MFPCQSDVYRRLAVAAFRSDALRLFPRVRTWPLPRGNRHCACGGRDRAALSPALRRVPRGVQYLISLFFLATTVVVLNELRKSNENMPLAVLGVWSAVRQTVGLPVLAILGLLLLAVALRYAIPITKWYRRVLLTVSVFAAFAMIRGIWILATMNFDSFHLVARHPHPGLPSAHRVVMVVFDEMDNEIAFTRRPKDLSLPNFDALRMTSVTFDSTYSPGPNTTESMPSYLLGLQVDSFRPLSANSFVALLKDGRRVLSDTARSIFSGPAARGARTALVGYALPYCRLRLTAMVDHCETIALVSGGTVNVQNEGFWRAVAQQTQSLLPFNERRAHIALLRVVIENAADLAADSGYSLVLLHLPLPHAPWIWDRRTNQFRVNILGDDGYLGNLALADRVRGRMRDEMTRRGTWDATTLIVTTDHPWRIKPNQGRNTDRRIPLMIKLPGMKGGEHIATPTNSIVVSSLLPALIDAQIPDAAALRLRVAQITASDSTFQPHHTP
jgi:Sulfatase